MGQYFHLTPPESLACRRLEVRSIYCPVPPGSIQFRAGREQVVAVFVVGGGHVCELGVCFESLRACVCSGVLVFALLLSECFEINFWIGQFILYGLSCKVRIS